MKIYYCYNIKTSEVIKCEGIYEVSKITKLDSGYVAEHATLSKIFRDEWLIIRNEDFRDSLGTFKKRYNVPKKLLNPYLKEAKDKIREIIYNAIIKAYPNDIQHKAIIVLKDENTVEVFSYEEVSKILNIPVGTVKSRLNRTKTLEDLQKTKCIKFEIFSTLSKLVK